MVKVKFSFRVLNFTSAFRPHSPACLVPSEGRSLQVSFNVVFSSWGGVGGSPLILDPDIDLTVPPTSDPFFPLPAAPPRGVGGRLRINSF